MHGKDNDSKKKRHHMKAEVEVAPFADAALTSIFGRNRNAATINRPPNYYAQNHYLR